MDPVCPMCQKKFSNLSIVAHVEICLKLSHKRTGAFPGPPQPKRASKPTTGGVLGRAAVVQPSRFKEYVEALSQSPTGVARRSETPQSEVHSKRPAASMSPAPVGLDYKEETDPLAHLDAMCASMERINGERERRKQKNKRVKRNRGSDHYCTAKEIFDDILSPQTRAVCVELFSPSALDADHWPQRQFILRNGDGVEEEGPDFYDRFWKGEESIVNALYAQLVRSRFSAILDSKPVEYFCSISPDNLDSVVSFMEEHGAKEYVQSADTGDAILGQPNQSSATPENNLERWADQMQRSGVADPSEHARYKEPSLAPTIVDCTDAPCSSDAFHSTRGYNQVNNVYTGNTVRNDNSNDTKTLPGGPVLRAARVVRPDGCTMRSGVDIDESSVVQRLPYGTCFLFDNTVELMARFEDCISVLRLHVTAIVNDSGDQPPYINSTRRTEHHTLVDGWVSLTGRTVDDCAPMVAYIS